MKKNNIFLYAPIYLALVIPTPGRFVYGFTIFLEMAFLALVGTLITSLIKKLKFEQLQTTLILITVISATILFRQTLILICPEVALTLGYVMFLPPISLFLLGVLFKDTEEPLKNRLANNMSVIGIFSIFGLLFFLIRDILGFGTFTFFGRNHQIFEKVLITSDKWAVFSFIASLPGALTLAGILLFVAIIIRKKISIVKNAEVEE